MKVGSVGYSATPAVKTRTVTVVDLDEAGLISIVHRAEWKRDRIGNKPSWALLDTEIVLALVAEVRRLRDEADPAALSRVDAGRSGGRDG